MPPILPVSVDFPPAPVSRFDQWQYRASRNLSTRFEGYTASHDVIQENRFFSNFSSSAAFRMNVRKSLKSRQIYSEFFGA